MDKPSDVDQYTAEARAGLAETEQAQTETVPPDGTSDTSSEASWGNTGDLPGYGPDDNTGGGDGDDGAAVA